MTRSNRTVLGLLAALALSLSVVPDAVGHANLAHERVQVTTSQLVYQAGDDFEFSLDAFPINNNNAYTWFIYIQKNETGERRYYPAFAADTVTDIVGSTSLFGSYTVPWINEFPMLGPGSWPDVGSPAALTVGTNPAVMDPGMYSLIVELRDPNGYMVLYSAQTKFSVVNAVAPLTGNITSDTTLSNDNAYLLQGTVFVNSPATLTIEKGTVIFGENASVGTLVIAQGAKINALGTRASPIIMTSDQPIGQQVRGQWGGLIINGNASINVPGGVAIGEGNTGNYGGGLAPDDDDSSGILRYLRVEYAGHLFSSNNELNGIAFQGVGRGTTVDHIQVHYNADDGVEFFGGTVNVKHILLTSNRDDSLDWTEGWTGKVQFVVAQQVGDEADRGMEGDNNADNNDYTPRAHPTIYNFTLIGDPDLIEGVESTQGMKIREGTSGTFRNFIVIGFKDVGIDIDHQSTIDQATAGSLTFDHGIVYGNGQAGDPVNNPQVNFDTDAAPFTTSLAQIDPLIVDPYDTKYPDYRPVLFSPAYNGQDIEIPPDDGFFDTNIWFLGGVDPFDDWTLGWTDLHYND